MVCTAMLAATCLKLQQEHLSYYEIRHASSHCVFHLCTVDCGLPSCCFQGIGRYWWLFRSLRRLLLLLKADALQASFNGYVTDKHLENQQADAA